MKIFHQGALAGAIAVGLVTGSIGFAPLANAQAAKQVPMRDFFKNPQEAGHQISPDGKYVHVRTDFKYRIYRCANGVFTMVFQADEVGFSTIKFMADQPDKAVLIRTEGFEIYNLVTMTTEFSAPFTSSFQEIFIDFNDNLIMTYDENFFKFYNLYTGTVVKTMIHGMSTHVYLHGHSLFYDKGSRMTFQE